MTRDTLIPPAQRLGLSRLEAAAYVGVSPSHFDGLVRTGLMPAAKRVGTGRIGWDRRRLEQAYDALPDAGPAGAAALPAGARDDGSDPRFEERGP